MSVEMQKLMKAHRERQAVLTRNEEAKAEQYRQCFSTESGEAVLADLVRKTQCIALDASATDAELRVLEGQRALVGMILGYIEAASRE